MYLTWPGLEGVWPWPWPPTCCPRHLFILADSS